VSHDALPATRQRIDKWLWHARIVRSRSAAASLASAGHVRINGGRIDASSRPVKVGDVLTISLDRYVRVLRVLSFAERRGPASATRGLYEDLEPVSPRGEGRPMDETGQRAPGSGRPTKRDRRVIDRFSSRDEVR